VYITHEAEIAAHAQRVITMRDGQVVADERRAARESAQSPVLVG
jgi:macrolide transport system ATP-binding/permease protein